MSRLLRWSPSHPLRVAVPVAAAFPVGLLLAMGYARRWVSEDAFIDLRVVQHLLAGHGPVFNLSERVEAYTNPVWVALLAVWAGLGASPEAGAVGLGLGLSATGLVLAQAGAARLGSRLVAASPRGERPGGALTLPFGAAVFAAIPAVWDFSTSGLESGLAMAWLGGVFWLLAGPPPLTRGAMRLAAVLIGCGPLVRPDLALFSVGFAAALLAGPACVPDRRPSGREWATLAVIGMALPLAYQVFRMGYFAALVPNTALAKEATAPYWSQGWRYLVDFAGPYALWIPLLAVAAWTVTLVRAARRHADWHALALVLATLVAALAHGLYVARVGGDFMHGRLWLPTLLALLLPVATVVVPAAALRGWRSVVLGGVGAWALACALWLRVPYEGQGTPGTWGIADERGFYTHHVGVPNPIYLDDYFHIAYVSQFRRSLVGHDRVLLVQVEHGLAVASPLAPSVPPSIRLAVGVANIGVLGYLSGVDAHVVDRGGLADPIAARLTLAARGRPGHEKFLPEAWLVARFGDPALAGGRSPAVPAAAAALRCGDLARLLRAVEAPLTLSRFLSNVRDAWSFHRLRIPADPGAARDRLCARPSGGPG